MKVLMVCTGNINRSAAAEVIYNTHARKRNLPFVSSAAVSENNKGMITTKKMRDALNRQGYQYYEIRSRPVTQELIDEHDLLLYMEDVHRRKLIAKFGMDIIPKLKPLADYSGGAIEKIPDPHFSKFIHTYDETVLSITQCVFGLIKEIENAK